MKKIMMITLLLVLASSVCLYTCNGSEVNQIVKNGLLEKMKERFPSCDAFEICSKMNLSGEKTNQTGGQFFCQDSHKSCLVDISIWQCCKKDENNNCLEFGITDDDFYRVVNKKCLSIRLKSNSL